jgi:hypothetical protein
MGFRKIEYDVVFPEGTQFSYFWIIRYSETDSLKAKLDIYRKKLGGEGGYGTKERYHRIVGIHEYISLRTIRSVMLCFRLKLKSDTVRSEMYSKEDAEELERAIQKGEV